MALLQGRGGAGRSALHSSADETGFPAEFEFVRCGLPAALARFAPAYTTDEGGRRLEAGRALLFAGMPYAIWSREVPLEAQAVRREYLVAWAPATGSPRTRRMLRRFDVDGQRGVFVHRRRGEPGLGAAPAGTAAPPSPPPGQTLTERLTYWHAQLFEKCASEKKVMLRAIDLRQPLDCPHRWRAGEAQIVDIAKSQPLVQILREHIENFALPTARTRPPPRHRA